MGLRQRNCTLLVLLLDLTNCARLLPLRDAKDRSAFEVEDKNGGIAWLMLFRENMEECWYVNRNFTKLSVRIGNMQFLRYCCGEKPRRLEPWKVGNRAWRKFLKNSLNKNLVFKVRNAMKRHRSKIFFSHFFEKKWKKTMLRRDFNF